MANIEFPLNLPQVRVLSTRYNQFKHFIIVVESTRKNARCRVCRKKISSFHGFDDPIQLRHTPLFDTPVFIEIRPKRFRCNKCDGAPTTTQACSWYTPRSPFTKAYEQSLMRQLINLTVHDIAQREGLGYHAVLGVLNRQVKKAVDWSQFESLETLGIDEISLRKGHGQFVTVISTVVKQGNAPRIEMLGLLQGRKKVPLAEFLRTIPQRLKSTVETVCIDMCEVFAAAVEQELPKARLVADRFHVAKAYRDGVDKLRKSEQKRLKAELSEKEYKELKGSLWEFRQNGFDLKEREALRKLLNRSEDLEQAWILREELRDIFERIDNKVGAKISLGRWLVRVRESGLKCFDSFVVTLENWWEPITNYFVAGESSGWVEGVNNKLKVLKRRCYGILNLDRFFQRANLDFAGYKRLAF